MKTKDIKIGDYYAVHYSRAFRRIAAEGTKVKVLETGVGSSKEVRIQWPNEWVSLVAPRLIASTWADEEIRVAGVMERALRKREAQDELYAERANMAARLDAYLTELGKPAQPQRVYSHTVDALTARGYKHSSPYPNVYSVNSHFNLSRFMSTGTLDAEAVALLINSLEVS